MVLKPLVRHPRLHRLAFWIIGVMPMWVMIHVCLTAADGLTDRGTKADFAVVPGTTVNADGTPSARLAARLDCAAELYHTRRVGGIILSAGTDNRGHDEAAVMERYLLGRGIPARCIFIDRSAVNTQGTVEHVLSMRPPLSYNSLIVVSQYFHVSRCKMLFRERGLREVESVSPEYFEWRDLWAVPREFIAFYTQL